MKKINFNDSIHTLLFVLSGTGIAFTSLPINAEEAAPASQSIITETEQAKTETNQAPTITPNSSIQDLLCGPRPPWPELKILSGEKTLLQSDSAEMRGKDVTSFTGDVVIKREAIQLEADTAHYFHSTDNIEANGNIRLFTPDIMITADQGKFNLNREQAELSNTTYQTKSGSNGAAEQIKKLNPSQTEMINASYTTCISKDPDWLIRSSKLMLDTESRQGSASHSVVWFKDVPFFYFPYLRFPIGNDRLSGFLFPVIGDSNRNGIEVILPYYWNIAPNYDATITPWYMNNRRSTMMMTEFRYLHKENYGQLEVDYMDSDKIYNNNRQRIKWSHQSTNNEGWATTVNYNRVTDTDHYIDFGSQLDNERPSHLEQSASLGYNASNWTAQIKTQAYQQISGGVPFELMPQVSFSTRLPQYENTWYPGLNLNTVNFYRNDTSVQGTRLNIAPYLALPLSNEAMYLTPKLTWQYTQYKLSNTSASQESEPSIDVPVFSIDSGVFFERNLKMGSNDFLQTLEPQLFYVYAPYRNQNDLPVFDTGAVDFNINDPSRENRFSGIDRIEDADRLTALLTTRFINDETGEEKFMARIGQIFYFDDRDVTLPGESIQTRTQSPYIAELVTRPMPHLYMSADARWDPDLKDYTSGNAHIEYNSPRHISLGINYRFQKDSLETNEVNLSWQLAPRWRISASKLYDIYNHREQENEHSIVYESCCWGLKLSSREQFINVDEPYEETFYLELELKGLASFGSGWKSDRRENYRRQQTP